MNKPREADTLRTRRATFKVPDSQTQTLRLVRRSVFSGDRTGNWSRLIVVVDGIASGRRESSKELRLYGNFLGGGRDRAGHGIEKKRNLTQNSILRNEREPVARRGRC